MATTITTNRSDEHNDYFTLTDETSATYEWHGRKDVEQDPDTVLLLIRKKEYPDAVVVTREAGEFDIPEEIMWPTVGSLPASASDYDGEKLYVVDDQHYVSTSGSWVPYTLETTPCEEETRQCNSLSEMTDWNTDNPSVSAVPWISTHPVGEVLDRGNISSSTRTALESLRTSDSSLTPIIDVLIGSE